MSTRIEATARALYAHNEAESLEAGAAFISMPPDEYDCCAKAALEAADAVMFSDEAIERIKLAIALAGNRTLGDYRLTPRADREVLQRQAEAVIAALRDAQEAK